MKPFNLESPITEHQPVRPRKPRVMVAGEFSSGKTKLINGLLAQEVLPSNVTATALPPIWLVSGALGLVAVDLEGNERPAASLQEVRVEDTSYCVLSHPAPCLRHFDIIDTPGNSDPNIPSESWERMLDFADTVVWCSNATQAWRQSEKSVWTDMPERLLSATMIITHADRMTDAHSADRVKRRVTREASRFFDHIVMASLINDEDIADISHHIARLSKGLPLTGAESAIASDFAAAQSKTGAASTPACLNPVNPDLRRENTPSTPQDHTTTARPVPRDVVTKIGNARARMAMKMDRNMS